ncbi:hypothetical protein RB213_007630 [Colletotrichum asianum]
MASVPPAENERPIRNFRQLPHSADLNMKDGGSQAASEVVSEPTVNGVANGNWPVPNANTTSPADGESDNSQSMFEVLRPGASDLTMITSKEKTMLLET